MSTVKHHRRANGYVSIYTNSVTIEYTAYDLSFRCGQQEQSEDGGVFIEEQGKVSMSLEHAKVLSCILADTIARIENEIGPIPDYMGAVSQAKKGERGQ